MTGTERILNGKFWYLLTKIAQLLELSLLWTLFSIPVVTIGASSAALFDLLGRLDTIGSKTFSTFWASFKAHWKPGSLWWLFTAAVAALGVVDLSICIPNFTTGYFMAVVTGLLVALLLIFTCMSAYLLPLSITNGRTFRESLRPAMVFALSNIVGNIVIVLTLAAGTWILGRIWYVGFLFPAFFALPISTVTRRAMGKAGLLPEEDDE